MKNVKTVQQYKQTFTQTGFFTKGSTGIFYTQKSGSCSLAYDDTSCSFGVFT